MSRGSLFFRGFVSHKADVGPFRVLPSSFVQEKVIFGEVLCKFFCASPKPGVGLMFWGVFLVCSPFFVCCQVVSVSGSPLGVCAMVFWMLVMLRQLTCARPA